MWKTLYDMCTGSPDEQKLYHSISTVATLLLQIGEVGKQYANISPKTAPQKPAPRNNDQEAELEPPSLNTESSDDQRVIPVVAHSESGTKSDSLRHASLTPADSDPLTDLLSDDASDDPESEAIVKQLEEFHLKQQVTDSQETSGKSPERKASFIDTPEKSRQCEPDPDWSINFEQFLASMLTESHLVAIFEKETDVKALVNQYRSRRLNSLDDDSSQSSNRSSPGSPSPLPNAVKIL